MAKKDHYDMNLEIHTRVTELNLYIEELHQKINMLMTHEDSIKSDGEVEALKARMEALKKDQEDVKKTFNEFIVQSYQSDDVKNLQVFTNIDEELEDLKIKIEGYKEEQEDLNKRFNELMIEFGISKDFGGSGISTGTEGQKEEDNVSKGMIELATGFVRSDHTSDVDLEVSTVIEGHQQEMTGLISDSEESEKETEEFKKNEGDVKGRLLEKLRGDDSSDNLEEVSSDISEAFSTNIPGLDQVMRELMHGSDKSEGSRKGGNVKKSNEAQKSWNSRLEKVISDQSGHIDLHAYTSVKGLKGKIYRLMDEERKSKGTLMEYGQFDNVDLGVCTNIEGLEQKMSALRHENTERSEKDQHIVNKRLKEWLKECDESDEEWKAVKAIKAEAIELATKLSQQLPVKAIKAQAIEFATKLSQQLPVKAIKAQAIEFATKLSQQLVDLLFLMSEWKEVLANFQENRSLLQWVIEDDNSVVINRIISVMELADKEIRKMKETEKVKSDSLEGSSVNMEEIDQFIEQFMKEVLRLEYILKLHGLPESQMLKKEVLASLEAGLDECDKELKAIEMKLNELEAMSSFSFTSDGSEINEIWKRAVNLKIKELWNGLEETVEE